MIVWGAGVRGPLPDSAPSSHDDYSAPWGLSHLLRRDVEQADVAALMSALVGIDWPVNSVGVLPDVDPTRPGYLSASPEEQARLAFTNAQVRNDATRLARVADTRQVILEHYRVKHGTHTYDCTYLIMHSSPIVELKKEHSLFYKPFEYLTPLEGFEDTPGGSRLMVILRLIEAQRFDEARETASELIRHSLAGIRYLETYVTYHVRRLRVSFPLSSATIAFS